MRVRRQEDMSVDQLAALAPETVADSPHGSARAPGRKQSAAKIAVCELMKTTAQAFLFDADAEGVPPHYGRHFDPAFLRALSAADPTGVTSSGVLRGDILTHHLCRRVIAASARHGHAGRTVVDDMELFRTVLWDLANAIAEQSPFVVIGDGSIKIPKR